MADATLLTRQLSQFSGHAPSPRVPFDAAEVHARFAMLRSELNSNNSLYFVCQPAMPTCVITTVGDDDSSLDDISIELPLVFGEGVRSPRALSPVPTKHKSGKQPLKSWPASGLRSLGQSIHKSWDSMVRNHHKVDHGEDSTPRANKTANGPAFSLRPPQLTRTVSCDSRTGRGSLGCHTPVSRKSTPPAFVSLHDDPYMYRSNTMPIVANPVDSRSASSGSPPTSLRRSLKESNRAKSLITSMFRKRSRSSPVAVWS